MKKQIEIMKIPLGKHVILMSIKFTGRCYSWI